MKLDQNINRLKELMGLNEQSYLDFLKNKFEEKEREENPFLKKTYDPNTKKDFSNSKVKDVVWRAGEIVLNPKAGGIWFGENKEDVEKFSISVRNEKRTGKPYFINLENPYFFDSFWNGYLLRIESLGRETLMHQLVRDGHDGIIIDTDTWNDTADQYSVTSKQYVVFNPENIKPAQ